MNQTIKTMWTTALRSNEYKQGHGELHKGDRHCLFGVLCDIHAKVHGIAWEHENDYGCFSYLGNTISPPHEVIVWAVLTGGNPVVIVNDDIMGLVSLNDDGISFITLANLIDDQL